MQQGNEVKGNAREEKEKEKEREDEGSWEFVPAKVPNGISLRNFGIQVVSAFFFLSFLWFSFFFSSFFSFLRSFFFCLRFLRWWWFEVVRFHALKDPIVIGPIPNQL